MRGQKGGRSNSVIKKLIMHIKDFFRGIKGQGLVEYALIIGLVAMIMITLISSIGKETYEFIAAAIQKLTKV
ncbi:MAG: hypothetical protein A2Y21_07110 [Clostridiales bacterium GWC2_40_7]|nr:MAG: hypothetical protein A2Y21_07110 [Clostridiales bacterium GWC2_40_7]